MAIKYYVSVYRENSKRDCEAGYDLVTTRKAEYEKFAKQALKDGAKSVEVEAGCTDQCTGQKFLSLVKIYYPEDFNAVYYVTKNVYDEIIYEAEKLNDAIKAAKDALNNPGVSKTYVFKTGEKNYIRSYVPKPYTNIRLKHAQLIKDDQGRICADMKSQNKSRDTSARYCFEDNTLVIAGKLIEKHPKFKNIEKFEEWVSKYLAESKDGFDL